MKRFAALIVLSTLIAATAFAADSGSGKIRLDSAVKVGTTELPAGEYKVTWTGSGDEHRSDAYAGKDQSDHPGAVGRSESQERCGFHEERERRAGTHRNPIPQPDSGTTERSEPGSWPVIL